MRDGVRRSLHEHPDWFHEAVASFSSIARVDIHVFAPQTMRAVVGVAGAGHGISAALTRKIFSSSSESFGVFHTNLYA